MFNYARRAAAFVPSRGLASQMPHRPNKTKGKTPTTKMKFYCLANCDDEEPPSTVAGKTELSNAGLGPATIEFALNEEASTHPKLVQRFPALSSCGYELLLYQRGGEDKGFHTLPIPYTPARLKDVAGQAIIYIWPLQRNITLSNQRGQESEVRFFYFKPEK